MKITQDVCCKSTYRNNNFYIDISLWSILKMSKNNWCFGHFGTYSKSKSSLSFQLWFGLQEKISLATRCSTMLTTNSYNRLNKLSFRLPKTLYLDMEACLSTIPIWFIHQQLPSRTRAQLQHKYTCYCGW